MFYESGYIFYKIINGYEYRKRNVGRNCIAFVNKIGAAAGYAAVFYCIGKQAARVFFGTTY